MCHHVADDSGARATKCHNQLASGRRSLSITRRRARGVMAQFTVLGARGCVAVRCLCCLCCWLRFPTCGLCCSLVEPQCALARACAQRVIHRSFRTGANQSTAATIPPNPAVFTDARCTGSCALTLPSQGRYLSNRASLKRVAGRPAHYPPPHGTSSSSTNVPCKH